MNFYINNNIAINIFNQMNDNNFNQLKNNTKKLLFII